MNSKAGTLPCSQHHKAASQHFSLTKVVICRNISQGESDRIRFRGLSNMVSQKEDTGMRVSGADNVVSGGASMSPGAGEPMDEVSKSLQKQIENLQKQMKELSANQEIPSETKMKKRQELQKQISELQVQLRQHQMEVKREEAKKKEEKASEENVFDSCRISDEGRKQSAGLSAGSMEAMISADAAMRQADVHGSTAQKMENRGGVLETEIKLDKARNGDTRAKEEELAKTKALAEKATASQMQSLSQANEVMKDASETDQRQEDGKKEEENQTSREAGQAEGVETVNGEPVPGTVSLGTGGMAGRTEETSEEQMERREQYHPVDVRI